ncbi:alpha/beta hydrolase [Candidatus Wolfebacteria bacterium]|nr:alpha/beta hydrolase [Candidatus Wolfebacteria bacterium]
MSQPILILHGWGRGAKSYEVVKQLLEEKGHLAYLFDLPGFGEAPAPDKSWSVDDYADFVLRFTQANNLDKVFLWGNSFGGRIAIKFAVSHPEKLNGLILCAAAGLKEKLNFRQRVGRVLARFGKPIFRAIAPQNLTDFMKRILYKFTGSRDFLLAPGIMKEVLVKTIAEDSMPYLSRIKTPTLIIWGNKDKILPLSDAYIMNKEILGSHLEILENVGHRPHKEAPEKLIEIIDGFIKNLKS